MAISIVVSLSRINLRFRHIHTVNLPFLIRLSDVAWVVLSLGGSLALAT